MAALRSELARIQSKDYTMALVQFAGEHAASGMKAQGKSVGKQLYDLDVLWNVIVCEDGINDALRKSATEELCLIIAKNETYKSEYVAKAGMSIISQTQGIPAAIRFLLRVDFARILVAKSGGTAKLDEFMKENDVVQKVLAHCGRYHDKVKKAFLESKNRGDLLRFSISPGDMPFSDQSGLYLELVKYLCVANEKTYATDLLLGEVWACYYNGAINEEHMGLLFKMLTSPGGYAVVKTIGPFVSSGAIKSFLDNYLSNEKRFDISKATLDAYKCFEKYFVLVKEESMKAAAFSPEKLPGLSMLWKLMLATKDEKVKTSSMDRLVKIYKESIKNEPGDKKIPVESFIRYTLSKATGSKEEILRILETIQVFIEKYCLFS